MFSAHLRNYVEGTQEPSGTVREELNVDISLGFKQENFIPHLYLNLINNCILTELVRYYKRWSRKNGPTDPSGVDVTKLQILPSF